MSGRDGNQGLLTSRYSAALGLSATLWSIFYGNLNTVLLKICECSNY